MTTTTTSADVLYIADVAAKLGKSTDAVRASVHRLMNQKKPVDLPRPFKIGSEWAWSRSTFDAWLADKERAGQ